MDESEKFSFSKKDKKIIRTGECLVAKVSKFMKVSKKSVANKVEILF